ncbi:MAG: hypothetical protein ACLP01_29000 [Solirubrobacteraceae bacterium]
MLGSYDNFFIASSGASAAILGLLFVAVTVANTDDADLKTRERRTVLAGSAFLALIDAFFVSILALTGGAVVFGLSSLVMAFVGLLGTSRLIPRAWRAGNFSRGFATRKLNIVFAAISAGGYSVQLGLAAALVANDRSSALQRALVLVVVCLYGSALGRAWEVMGIGRRRYGLTPEDRSVTGESLSRPGSWGRKELHDDATQAHAGADRPEVAGG